MPIRDLSKSVILVTGGAGFIGSNFIYHLIEHYPLATIVNLDKLTYAGNLENLSLVGRNNRYHFVRGDINSREDVAAIFDKYDIDLVVNFAAESHVDRSISDVRPFIDTNISGTANLMNIAKEKWSGKLGEKLFVHVSTDEVYGSLGETGKFTEETPIAPKNPYSSSKAAADMMVLSFVNTYEFPAVITRCSNNYGPYQFPEKLIPLTIINILNGKAIPVYGDGRQIRDWIYVADHCSGIDAVMTKGKIGDVYNLGGNAETYNIDLVSRLCQFCDKNGAGKNSERLITYVKDRAGHDRRYSMDITKTSTELGWTPKHDLKNALEETVCWYLKNRPWWERLLNRDYEAYYNDQYGAR